MPRLPRLQAAGAFYHINSRGVLRLPIYEDSSDRTDFLTILGLVVEVHEWRCFSYCLLTNHYHLLVETPQGDIAQGMQKLNGNYARSFNRRHGRKGHAFEDRYNAVFIQSHSHLLQVLRYIALNPVRAGLCSDPANWEWSSYAATIGRVPPPSFLAVDDVLGFFRPPQAGAEGRFAAFVMDGLEL